MNAMIEKPTKALSKKQKRARNRERNRTSISLPGGESVTVRRGQGQRKPAEDAQKVALEARVRVFGMDEENAVELAKSPMRGSGVGQCIIAITKQADHLAVWGVWQRLCMAQYTYRTRILGMSGNPQGSAIAMQSDALQCDISHTIDIRDAEQKDTDARRAWANAEASIKALPVPQWTWAIRNAMSGGMDGMGGDVWRNGKPTERGKVLVQALVALGGLLAA